MSESILVVDDQVITADRLCGLLKKQGYMTPEPAIKYEMAVSALSSQLIDMALIDIELDSGKSGIDLANYIKSNYQIPFIFITSHSDDATIKKAKKTGPYGYLLKPFNERMINASIQIAFELFREKEDWMISQQQLQKYGLTNQETVVLEMIANYSTTGQIAEKLCLSTSTIKNHRHNITRKLKLPPNTNSLLNWALANRSLFKK